VKPTRLSTKRLCGSPVFGASIPPPPVSPMPPNGDGLRSDPDAGGNVA
jgi:hypothetical protein